MYLSWACAFGLHGHWHCVSSCRGRYQSSVELEGCVHIFCSPATWNDERARDLDGYHHQDEGLYYSHSRPMDCTQEEGLYYARSRTMACAQEEGLWYAHDQWLAHKRKGFGTQRGGIIDALRHLLWWIRRRHTARGSCESRGEPTTNPWVPPPKQNRVEF